MSPQQLILTAAEQAGESTAFDFDRFASRNMELALGFILVCTAGALLAFVAYRLGAAWSVPLPGAAVGLPLAAISPLAGIATATTCVLAAGILFRWQRADEERGGVEGQRARERRGPLAAARQARERRTWRERRVRDGRLALGETSGGDVATVPFGSHGGVRAFIPGAPGSGKTVDLAVLAHAYISEGQGVVAIDPKGDPALRTELRHAASVYGRRFVEWTPQGPSTYNPLARGSASEIVDKALAGEAWTEPHYLRQAQRYLNLELQALRAAGEWPADLRSVVAHLDPDRLDALCDRAGGEIAEQTTRYLEALSARSRSELGGVRDRLAVLAESDLGRYLVPADDREEIELLSALREGAVAYLQLDSDRFALASQILGAAIVSDLVAATGEAQSEPVRGLVIIDEFAAVAAGEVARLLSRSRSAGISVVLATQAFADLSVARPGDSTDSLRRQVLSHVDYVLAHRQSEPESAELLGQMAGTKPAWSVVRRANTKPLMQRSLLDWGREEVTRRRTREFVRHPDEFKRLCVGEAILIEPSGEGLAERVRVWPAERQARFEQDGAPGPRNGGRARRGLSFPSDGAGHGGPPGAEGVKRTWHG